MSQIDTEKSKQLEDKTARRREKHIVSFNDLLPPEIREMPPHKRIYSRRYREALFNLIAFCASDDLFLPAKEGYFIFTEIGIEIDSFIFHKVWEKGREEYMQAAGIKFEDEILFPD